MKMVQFLKTVSYTSTSHKKVVIELVMLSKPRLVMKIKPHDSEYDGFQETYSTVFP